MTSTKDAPETLQDLETLLKNDNKVKVAGIDVDGVLRGKFMSKEKFLSAASSDGFGFCSVIFGWDIHDTVYSRELLISNKANGYRDILASIDLSTYRRIPWENNVPFFLVSFLDPDTKEPLVVDPRGILKITSDRAAKSHRSCYAGVEYEYFNFKETPVSLAEKKFQNLTPITPGMHGYSLLRTQLNNEYFHSIFDEASKFGVDIEGHHTETGPGVLETALAYTNALRMADNAILFKFLTKSIGMQHGVLPTFMAKPWGNLPGCSGHTHVSLRDDSGKNIFAVSEAELLTGRPGAANDDMVSLMLVPTINGYKRLVGGEAFWAPNAITYGYDSRAASIRTISPPSVPSAATRLEIRVPGADMNPYFTISAIFLLGLRGIEKKLKLSTPPMSKLTADDKKNGTIKMLPTSLEAATERMMRPESIAREKSMFGDVFVEHFGGTREHEVKVWNEAVTNWEVERYIELA
ncbi:glutamine synthetase guanido kinase [Lentinula edodes]|uniref:Glutamine synthetase n=1 Tax=Lentinula edodes TaxID=5353 RepID=A0A1Q3E278_LENED|nr:glutamine synthetase guanido kinase [Lentinula edodes]